MHPVSLTSQYISRTAHGNFRNEEVSSIRSSRSLLSADPRMCILGVTQRLVLSREVTGFVFWWVTRPICTVRSQDIWTPS